jgi:hypothetical protein
MGVGGFLPIQKATRMLIAAEPIGYAQNVALPSAHLCQHAPQEPQSGNVLVLTC